MFSNAWGSNMRPNRWQLVNIPGGRPPGCGWARSGGGWGRSRWGAATRTAGWAAPCTAIGRGPRTACTPSQSAHTERDEQSIILILYTLLGQSIFTDQESDIAAVAFGNSKTYLRTGKLFLFSEPFLPNFHFKVPKCTQMTSSLLSSVAEPKLFIFGSGSNWP